MQSIQRNGHVDGKSITFSPLATTRMACAEALNAQEPTYLKALQQAQWFTVAGNTLTIYTKAMEQPLVDFRSKSRSSARTPVDSQARSGTIARSPRCWNW